MSPPAARSPDAGILQAALFEGHHTWRRVWLLVKKRHASLTAGILARRNC
jgi:hypothetical protein